MTARDWEALLLPGLRQALPEHAHRALSLIAAHPTIDYTNSYLHFFNVQADGRAAQAIAVKEARAAGSEEIRLEFEGMRRLWAHLAGHPSVRSPRPFFCLTQPPALVMEAVQGERLHQVLAACRRPQRRHLLDRAFSCVRRAGEGLSLLHQIAPAPGAMLLPPPSERAQAALQRLQGVGVPARRIDSLRRSLAPLLEADPPAGPLVSLHGDYTLRNVLCAAEDKVVLLDTSLHVAGPPSHDVGYFLAALAFIDRWHLLAGRLAYSATTVATMRQAFLAGYGSAAGLEAGQVALYAVLRLLERWGQYAEMVQANPSAVARLLLRARGHAHFAAAVGEAVQQ